jgi:hypothetical protein
LAPPSKPTLEGGVLRNSAHTRSPTSAQAEAKIIAGKTHSIFGAALQASRGFQPTLDVQLALGHAQDATEQMVFDHLIERDRHTSEKIHAVFESTK